MSCGAEAGCPTYCRLSALVSSDLIGSVFTNHRKPFSATDNMERRSRPNHTSDSARRRRHAHTGRNRTKDGRTPGTKLPCGTNQRNIGCRTRRRFLWDARSSFIRRSSDDQPRPASGPAATWKNGVIASASIRCESREIKGVGLDRLVEPFLRRVDPESALQLTVPLPAHARARVTEMLRRLHAPLRP